MQRFENIIVFGLLGLSGMWSLFYCFLISKELPKYFNPAPFSTYPDPYLATGIALFLFLIFIINTYIGYSLFKQKNWALKIRKILLVLFFFLFSVAGCFFIFF